MHLPGEKFTDFGKIREEIVKDTEAKTGKNAGKLFIPIIRNHHHNRNLPTTDQSASILSKGGHTDNG